MRANLRTLAQPDTDKPSLLLRSFQIAAGKQAGDKQREGDNKTPEGIYFALPHIEADQLLTSKYGRRAIPLNFPNPIDQLENKTGYGIWLHGAGDDSRIADAKATEGCVAFYNADILRLKSWIRPHQSLVVIARDLDLVNQQKERWEVNDLTRQWLEAWQSQDLDRYMSFYSRDFSQGKRDRNTFRRYKERLFRSYRSIKIRNSGLWVLTHPKYAVSFMNQDFRGGRRFHSLGRKILYWIREQNSWKIIAEKFNRHLFQPFAFNGEDIRRLNQKGAG